MSFNETFLPFLTQIGLISGSYATDGQTAVGLGSQRKAGSYNCEVILIGETIS